MSNNHYPVAHEFEVELKFKVKVKSISNYHSLTEEEIQEILKSLEADLKGGLYSKIKDDYSMETNITDLCDYVSYEVEKIQE